MKIDSLTGVLRFFKEPAKTAAEQAQNTTQTEDPKQNAEAVRVARDFGRGADQAEASKRQTKIDELRRQVDGGRYKPDSKLVAIAVAKDLLI